MTRRGSSEPLASGLFRGVISDSVQFGADPDKNPDQVNLHMVS